jgi:hypothetical protein
MKAKFDSQPLKVRNHLDFHASRWRATYRWKDLDKGYNFVLNLISIEGLQTKLWAPKVAKVPTLGISRFHLRVPRQNPTWMMVPWPVTKYIVRGKVIASPKPRPW